VAEQRKPVPAQTWRRIFQEDPDGVAILEELAAEHVYSEQLVPGQPDQTHYNLGMKALVMKIMAKCAD